MKEVKVELKETIQTATFTLLLLGRGLMFEYIS